MPDRAVVEAKVARELSRRRVEHVVAAVTGDSKEARDALGKAMGAAVSAHAKVARDPGTGEYYMDFEPALIAETVIKTIAEAVFDTVDSKQTVNIAVLPEVRSGFEQRADGVHMWAVFIIHEFVTLTGSIQPTGVMATRATGPIVMAGVGSPERVEFPPLHLHLGVSSLDTVEHAISVISQ